MLRPAIPIDPGALAPATRERDDGATTLEIVPQLLAIEHREKFGIVQPVELPAGASAAGDQRRVTAEIEQAPAHASRAEKSRSSRKERMQDVAAHEGPVGEEQRRRGAAGTAGRPPGGAPPPPAAPPARRPRPPPPPPP